MDNEYQDYAFSKQQYHDRIQRAIKALFIDILLLLTLLLVPSVIGILFGGWDGAILGLFFGVSLVFMSGMLPLAPLPQQWHSVFHLPSLSFSRLKKPPPLNIVDLESQSQQAECNPPLSRNAPPIGHPE